MTERNDLGFDKARHANDGHRRADVGDVNRNNDTKADTSGGLSVGGTRNSMEVNLTLKDGDDW